jgi:hypothetical protein
LGWLDSIQTFRGRIGDITAFATGIKDAGYTHSVLLGMGGSSLCAEVSRDTFGSAPGWPQLLVLDNTDPAAIREVESHLDLTRTLFVVSSKSGTTTETLNFYQYFYECVSQHVVGRAGDHFVAITDLGTPLWEEARHQHFRHCFENPEDIGGCYSALSYFGLVPMALMGIDIATILEGWQPFFDALQPDERQLLLKMLRDAYLEEVQDVTQFTQHAERMHYPQFRERLLHIVAEEQAHVQWLRDKLLALGGELPAISLPPKGAKNAWQALLTDLEEEKRSYTDLMGAMHLAERVDPEIAEGIRRIREERATAP